MKTNVTESDFVRAFGDYGREDNFSREALCAIYGYLDALGEGSDEEAELDVIAVCCEFTEYENLKEFQDAYSTEYETIEDIENATTVIPVSGDSFIIQDF